MLFLAVFCGFLAEYKLEQTIERHREKEYMQLMVEDLKKVDMNQIKKARELNNLATKLISLIREEYHLK